MRAAPLIVLLLGSITLTACGGHRKPMVVGDVHYGERYKIGSPYQIRGITYYPRVDYRYQEVGIASWYGSNFHGRKTANGAIFNMYAVSAAHRTLPLPSVVEVQNLRNGRKIVVPVNDRGPFHDNRIIDLSMRAAELLGFKKSGTTRVSVRILEAESRRLATAMQSGQLSNLKKLKLSYGKPAKPRKVTTKPLPDIVESRPAAKPDPQPYPQPNPPIISPKTGEIYVQVSAYLNQDAAIKTRARVTEFPSTIGRVDPKSSGATLPIYRVLVGPFDNTNAANRAREKLIGQNFPGAHLISWEF